MFCQKYLKDGEKITSTKEKSKKNIAQLLECDVQLKQKKLSTWKRTDKGE